MSQTYSGGFIVATIPGVTVTSAATSASVAIPNASDGNTPRFIRVASTTASYVALGVAGVTVSSNGILVQAGDAVTLAVPSGITHLAYIWNTAASKINITPLESS